MVEQSRTGLKRLSSGSSCLSMWKHYLKAKKSNFNWKCLLLWVDFNTFMRESFIFQLLCFWHFFKDFYSCIHLKKLTSLALSFLLMGRFQHYSETVLFFSFSFVFGIFSKTFILLFIIKVIMISPFSSYTLWNLELHLVGERNRVYTWARGKETKQGQYTVL